MIGAKRLWRNSLAWAAVVLTAALTLWGPALACEPGDVAAKPEVIEILLHDTLQPVSAAMLRDQLAQANERHPAAILLDVSTPGGTAESAVAMAQLIRSSSAPVLVFVHVPRTQVAGEGLRLLLAGSAAAMDPNTHLMPLRPLHHGTGTARAARQQQIEALEQFVRAELMRRGRDPQPALDYLRMGAEVSPAAALQAGLLDAVTEKEDSALRSLRQRDPAGQAVLGSAHVVTLPLTAQQHLMRALMNPDLTVLLLTLGSLLIFLEMNTPGSIIPGAAGVLLVLLSVYALLQMPLRWQGVGLLIVSAAMLLAETQFARGSAFGVAAVVALTLGLRLLVKGPIPELEVDWSTSCGAGLGFGGITAGLVLLGVRARRAKVKTGAEAMLGWLAVAHTALEPTGEVLVRGELWRARLSAGNSFLPAGECVKVQGAEGMELEVAPMALNLQEADTALSS